MNKEDNDFCFCCRNFKVSSWYIGQREQNVGCLIEVSKVLLWVDMGLKEDFLGRYYGVVGI